MDTMAQPLAVPFAPHHSIMLPAAYMMHPLTAVPEGDTIMHEADPYKGSLRIDECDDEDDADVKPRAAKRSRMSFQCDECGTCYTEKRALARHRHTDQHRKKLGLPPNKKHSCSVCGKLFGRGHDLKRHYNEQHPNHAAGRTTPGSNHSGEAASSGASDYGGSEHAFSTDGAAGSSASPMTAATALSHSTYDRCGSSASLPDEKPPRSFNSPEQPGHSGVVRRVRTMSDLNQSPVPVIRMNQIDEMDISNDEGITSSIPPPHLRPSASMSSLAQRSDASSMRLSVYSTDQSVNTPATDCTPDLHPYSTKTIAREHPFQANATLKPNDDSVRAMACTMCSDTFEDDPDELLVHLRRHLEELKGEFRCHECFIGFVHKEDLERHKQAAAQGNCGFNFPHVRPCTGHHPPTSSSSAWVNNIPDSDSFRLCNKLRHWEQSQLSAYVSEVNSLIASRKERKFERWSVGEIMRASRNSFRVSVNTYASAPCDVDEDGKHDIGGLQQRLRQMSLKKAGTSLKSIIRKQRFPGESIPEHQHPPAVLSKHIQQAISRGIFSRADKLLKEEGQQRAVQYADPTLTAEALWGQSFVQHRTAEHRTSEAFDGTCTICHIKNSTFDQQTSGLSKIKMLIAHGADPNQPGGLCGFPVNTAAWMGKAEVVKYLLYKGARKEGHLETNHITPLCTAAAQGDSSGSLKVINTLLDHRADVHFRGPEGSALELVKKRMESLAMEALGMEPSRSDFGVRQAWCYKIMEVLEKAERCMTPPMTGTLYCADNSLRGSGGGGREGGGVATFKSFRAPSAGIAMAG